MDLGCLAQVRKCELSLHSKPEEPTIDPVVQSAPRWAMHFRAAIPGHALRPKLAGFIERPTFKIDDAETLAQRLSPDGVVGRQLVGPVTIHGVLWGIGLDSGKYPLFGTKSSDICESRDLEFLGLVRRGGQRLVGLYRRGGSGMLLRRSILHQVRTMFDTRTKFALGWS